MKSPLSFLTLLIHINCNNCISCGDYNKRLKIVYAIEIKGQSQIFLKSVTLLIIQTPFSCIDVYI